MYVKRLNGGCPANLAAGASMSTKGRRFATEGNERTRRGEGIEAWNFGFSFVAFCLRIGGAWFPNWNRVSQADFNAENAKFAKVCKARQAKFCFVICYCTIPLR